MGTTTAPAPAGDLRDRLVAATEAVMRRDGPLHVRVEEVARLAGCSRATLYRHVADKDELVREVLAAAARTRAGEMAPDLARIDDPGDRIAEGVLRTVEAVEGEWWYAALARHGATAAVARLGGGPHAFVALTVPLVAPFVERLAAEGRLRPGTTVADATEWLCVATTGLLATGLGTARTRADRVAFLRRFVADPLLRRRA
ncbi:MAG TPA: TetR/AcrR family transcriptional regulator [Acidimicrobiales bacterium]|nr:TetR/AcrR family transcriptional regulator [Acidimicrobiales bacterium]